MRIGAIIQARFDSSRLPGKALLKLPSTSNDTILSNIVARLRMVKSLNQIILATSTGDEDNPLEEEGKHLNVQVYRGSKKNVLDRFYQVAKKNNLDVILRITGDNPILFPFIIEENLRRHIELKNDYTKSLGLPIGTNFEIISFGALHKSWQNGKTMDDYEHVTLYINKNKSDFKVDEVSFQRNNYENWRLTVDYPSDYAMVNLLLSVSKRKINSLTELEEIINENPWILEINESNVQQTFFETLEQEVNFIIPLLEKYNCHFLRNRMIKLIE